MAKQLAELQTQVSAELMACLLSGVSAQPDLAGEPDLLQHSHCKNAEEKTICTLTHTEAHKYRTHTKRLPVLPQYGSKPDGTPRSKIRAAPPEGGRGGGFNTVCTALARTGTPQRTRLERLNPRSSVRRLRGF